MIGVVESSKTGSKHRSDESEGSISSHDNMTNGAPQLHCRTSKQKSAETIEDYEEAAIKLGADRTKCRQRRLIMPGVFDRDGCLTKKWKHLFPRINALRESLHSEHQASAGTQQSPEDTVARTSLEASLSIKNKQKQTESRETRATKRKRDNDFNSAQTSMRKEVARSQLKEKDEMAHLEMHHLSMRHETVESLDPTSAAMLADSLIAGPSSAVVESSSQLGSVTTTEEEGGNLNGISDRNNPATDCSMCHSTICSCNQTPIPAEEILCSEPLCPKRWYDNDYLERYCGMSLGEAQDIQNVHSFWYCPICAFKEERNRTIQGPNPLATLRIPSKFGRERFDEQAFTRQLSRLRAMTIQYVSAVDKVPYLPVNQHAFLDLPVIRNEDMTGGAHAQIATQELRWIFDVPAGISIKDKMTSLPLQEFRKIGFLRGVLAAAFTKLIFEFGSPFEECRSLKDSLCYSKFPIMSVNRCGQANASELGFSEEIAEMIIQDRRHRQIETPSFQKHISLRGEKMVSWLNSVMLPVVGASRESHEFHRHIVEVVSDLNAKVWMDRGIVAEIFPRTGELFNADLHVLDDPDVGPKDLSGQPILLTVLPGVRCKAPGKEWRVCTPAKVVLIE